MSGKDERELADILRAAVAGDERSYVAFLDRTAMLARPYVRRKISHGGGDPDDLSRIRSLSAMMRSSVTRMSALIDDVLDFARGKLGDGIKLDRHLSGDLKQALEGVITELRTSNPDREIVSHLDITSNVESDHARIAQMLSNLVANALSHGAADRPVAVRAHQTPLLFELSVSNAGEAIPPAVMSNLFKPFVRASSRPSQQGLGLGLYICAEIAKAHGGTLDVTSTPHETRFTYRMPVA